MSSNQIEMPTSIRIGPFNYIIETLDPKDVDHHSILGDFNHYLQRIRIHRDMGIQRQAETLMHEVLHGAWANAHLGKEADEETVVTRISYQLIQILRDNPDFVSFIDAASKQGAA